MEYKPESKSQQILFVPVCIFVSFIISIKIPNCSIEQGKASTKV